MAIKLGAGVALALFLLHQTGAQAQECQGTCYPKRWVYWTGDPFTADVDKFRAMVKDAKAAGFNGIAMAGSGNGSYVNLIKKPGDCVTPGSKNCLEEHIASLVEIVTDEGLEAIPVGGGPEVPASIDPHLVEAFPITQEYVLSGDKAIAKDSGVNLFSNADFANGFDGWNRDGDDTSGTVLWDRAAGNADHFSIRIKAPTRPIGDDQYMARLMRQIKLEPNTPYQLSFDLSADAMADADKEKIRVFVQNRSPEDNPLYVYRGIGWGTATNGGWNENDNRSLFVTDGSWRGYNFQFNSGQAGIDGTVPTTVFYFGFYGKPNESAEFSIDNVKLQKIGISHHVTRSPSTDIVVKSLSGKQISPNNYTFIDPDPASGLVGKQIQFKAGAIPQEQKLTVFWRQSTEKMFTSYPAAISCNDGVASGHQLNLWNKIKPVFAQSSKYFIYFDEVRAMNLEPADTGCSLPSGYDYANRVIRRMQNLIISPETPVQTIVWSDMFNPEENAVSRYFQVKGSMRPVCNDSANACDVYSQDRASATGLQYNTVIANWTGGSGGAKWTEKRKKSLKFFKDFPQLAAVFYDDASQNLDSVTSWLDALANPDSPVTLDGFMYTTWEKSDYTKLAAVAEKIRQHPSFKDHWPKK